MHQLEAMPEEPTFMDDIDKTVLVPVGGGRYVCRSVRPGRVDRCDKVSLAEIVALEQQR